ncbi:MAG: hypothetical protein ABJE10_15825 [bacterium]
MPTTMSVSRRSGETPAVALRLCRFCCGDIPIEAKKCRHCGEWLVGTSGGFASGMLKILGVMWAGATVLAAAGLWYVGQGIRRWAWMHAVDQQITPQLVDLALYAVIAIVLLKGLMLSLGLGIMARLSPRRPRWWS